MGRKITIDSATLMNKGLEVIEAHWLFDVPADRIDVVVHPQSIVHSMVELTDGSTIAQLGVTDMRLPIQYALSYPERWAAPLPPLDLTQAGALEFEAPGHRRFPCLRLAYDALVAGGTMPVVAQRGQRGRRGRFPGRARCRFPPLPRSSTDAVGTRSAADRLAGSVREADRRAREYSRALTGSLELPV